MTYDAHVYVLTSIEEDCGQLGRYLHIFTDGGNMDALCNGAHGRSRKLQFNWQVPSAKAIRLDRQYMKTAL